MSVNPANTLVMISSALYVGMDGAPLQTPSPERLKRLNDTVEHLAAQGFTHYFLADNTLPAGTDTVALQQALQSISNIPLHWYFIPEASQRSGSANESSATPPASEWLQHGPSRLEAVMLYQALPYIERALFKFNADYVLKISAGYRIKNLTNILPKASGGLIYRMGNPFRIETRFCLSSFFILPADKLPGLIRQYHTDLAQLSAKTPLEHSLYRYVRTTDYRLTAAPYPRIDAYFASAGMHASHPSYQRRELIFRILSRLGLFAYRIS